MIPVVSLVIPGRVAILKNSKRVIARGRGRRVLVLPSERYAAWEQNAMVSLRGQFKGMLVDYPCEIRARFYFATRQGEADVSNMIQGPEDVLQKVGILKDDKLVMRIEMEKFFGHEPRVELEIYKYEKESK